MDRLSHRASRSATARAKITAQTQDSNIFGVVNRRGDQVHTALAECRFQVRRFPLTPQQAVHDVRQVMPEDGIVCLDNGMYKIWFARNYRTHVANTLLLDNALATMGAGLPAAIAVAILHPRRRVLAVCGDGGFMMNSQEMETAVRLRLEQGDLSIAAMRCFVKWNCILDVPLAEAFGKRVTKYGDSASAKRRTG